jgi:hypothetical protein
MLLAPRAVPPQQLAGRTQRLAARARPLGGAARVARPPSAMGAPARRRPRVATGADLADAAPAPGGRRPVGRAAGPAAAPAGDGGYANGHSLGGGQLLLSSTAPIAFPVALAPAAAPAAAAAAQPQLAAAAASAAPPPSRAAAAAAAAAPPRPAASDLRQRVASGLLLGAAGAAAVVAGGGPFLAVILLVVYLATQEYFGLVTSLGVTRGDDPPPPLVAAATTALCLGITVLTHALGCKCGTALSVAAFALLALNVAAVPRPSFGGLTTSLFGLFYCGRRPGIFGAGGRFGVREGGALTSVASDGRRGRGGGGGLLPPAAPGLALLCSSPPPCRVPAPS